MSAIAIGTLEAGVRKDLADWLLCLADNKRLIGLRYAEWCTGAPELEADITVAAMAQYELGHARLIRGILGDLPENPEEADARRTDPAAWRSLPTLDRPLRGWPELAVVNALIDTLLTANMQAARDGSVASIAQRLKKAVAEEHYHTVHGGAWIERLLQGPDEILERVREAVAAIWPDSLAWFGPDEDGSLDRLHAAGVLDAGRRQIRDRYLDVVVPLLRDSVDLQVSRGEHGWTVEMPIDWADWSAVTRRRGSPRFDKASFEMITGAHARAMGVED